MADKKTKLTKRDRFNVMWHSQFLQGSWNYERMQNGGYAYSMIPALRKLYPNKKDLSAALQRHLVFFNTHPYLASPVLGVTLALEEDKANGAEVTDDAIQGVKVGMMGPLAGVGDPVFWYTVRPIVGALGASMAIAGNVMGPILFFVIWNIIRIWKNGLSPGRRLFVRRRRRCLGSAAVREKKDSLWHCSSFIIMRRGCGSWNRNCMT